MNVFFIENENPCRNSSGGAMTYINNLSLYLREHGIVPTLVGSGAVPQTDENPAPWNFNYLPVAKHGLSNIHYLIRVFRNHKRIPDSEDTLLHAQRAELALPFLLFHKKSKVLLTIHDPKTESMRRRKGRVLAWLYTHLLKWVMEHVDATIVVNQNFKRAFEKHFSIHRCRIETIPIGISTHLFYPSGRADARKVLQLPGERKIVAFIGRLEYPKNVEFIIRACALAQQEVPGLLLVVVGDGSQKDDLVRCAQEVNFEDILFLSELPYNLIPQVYNAADVLSLASFYEGSPTVIREAVACNLPVVTLAVGDAEEYLSDLDQCSVCEYDEKAFARGLVDALTRPNRPNYHGKNDWVSYKFMGDRTLKVYSSL